MYLTRNYDGTVIEGRLNTNVPDEHIEDSITLKDMQGNAVNKLTEVYAEAVYKRQCRQKGINIVYGFV